MSAIWGVWRRDGEPRAREDMSAMSAAFAAYGTSAPKMWSRGPVGMGVSLAVTVPEDDFDTQPLIAGEDGTRVLVADLRLDNRADLARELDIPSNAQVADSQLLEQAWEGSPQGVRESKGHQKDSPPRSRQISQATCNSARRCSQICQEQIGHSHTSLQVISPENRPCAWSLVLNIPT